MYLSSGWQSSGCHLASLLLSGNNVIARRTLGELLAADFLEETVPGNKGGSLGKTQV